MGSTTDIAAKHAHLKQHGVDLGAPTGSEIDLDYGGRLQKYVNGHIYWHAQVGCFEVHGGILKEYLRLGGHDKHPRTGKREFGFPKADEARTPDGEAIVSEFEWGRIYWISGVGAVPLYGRHVKDWKNLRHAAPQGVPMFLGYPNAEPMRLPSGSIATFCGFGAMFTAGADEQALACYYQGPLLGCPALTTPDGFEATLFKYQCARSDSRWIAQNRPTLMAELWKDRVFLQSVKNPQTLIALELTSSARPGTHPAMSGILHGSQITSGGSSSGGAEGGGDAGVDPLSTHSIRFKSPAGTVLPDRTLFNIVLKLPNGRLVTLGMHAVYTKASWSDFGLMHATDTHVAERCDRYHRVMIQKGRTEALRHYNNYNEAFRSLIRKANELHDQGQLDAIAITGDLVDYQFEDGKGEDKTGGNFAFFEKLVRGAVKSPVDSPVEELRVPIFTTLGNHDYRKHAYLLTFSVKLGLVDVPGVGGVLSDIASPVTAVIDALGVDANPNLPFDHYKPHNLTSAESGLLQGGFPELSPSEAAAQVAVSSPDYYFQRINRHGRGTMDCSFIVKLGQKHRLVMIDSGPDVGITTDVVGAFTTSILGLGSDDEISFVGGSPNLRGVSGNHLKMLSGAMAEAGEDGLVLVGIHGPPINTAGSEFAPFFRETIRARDVTRDVLGFLHRRSRNVRVSQLGAPQPNPQFNPQLNPIPGSEPWWSELTRAAKGIHKGWMDALGKPHFMQGTVDDLLDMDGVSKGRCNDFLKLCAGKDVPGFNVNRSADVIFSGHGHYNVEYRIRWDAASESMRFFMDFYTHNPKSYYTTRISSWDLNQPVWVSVKSEAKIDEVPVTNIQDPLYDGKEAFLETPPYPKPLNESTSPAQWWSEHRPLIMQTAGAGPREGSANDWKVPGNPRPGPTFQGFRIVEVKNDQIRAIRNVRLP